ncbi:MAG: alkaline phosphatase [Candidatus Abyssubacteria bacterium]
MKTRFCILLVLLLAAIALGCNGKHADAPAAQSVEHAQNIILMIGDGMSVDVIGLARQYARSVEARELWMEKLMSEGHLALVDVSPLKKAVTDSAAAATALASGEKTLNGRVSVGPQGQNLTTILELAKRDSRGTGLVTTTRLSHATPACFAAHLTNRNAEAKIAEQMLAAEIDVLLGGGLAAWIPKGAKASDFGSLSALAGADTKSGRNDTLNLLEQASRKAYRLITNREELLASDGTGKLLGLFAASHLPYALDRQPEDLANVPSLAEMTSAALEYLSQDNRGFFLMVEGGRIDHAAHNNDVAAMLAETIDFDEAVGVALAFAKQHPHTLLLITADHATGAPALSARYSDETEKTLYPGDDELKKIGRQDASFEYMMLALSKQPSVENLLNLVRSHAGIEITGEQARFILDAGPISPFHVIKPRYRKFGYRMLALGQVLGVEYGTTWATAEHSAAPVLLITYGPRAHLMHGYVENTDIFKLMKTAAGL